MPTKRVWTHFIIQPESRHKNIGVFDINGVKEMVEALEHTKHENGKQLLINVLNKLIEKIESILNENKDQDVIKREFNGKIIEVKKDSLQHSIGGIKKWEHLK
jgi:hypothetical protein